MLSQELDQWWRELGQNCSEEFASCTEDLIDEDTCEGLCKDFCKNVIESFEAWKQAQEQKGADDVRDKTDVDS